MKKFDSEYSIQIRFYLLNYILLIIYKRDEFIEEFIERDCTRCFFGW